MGADCRGDKTGWRANGSRRAVGCRLLCGNAANSNLVMARQSCPVRLFIDAFQLENHRPRAVVATGYHDFFIVGPAAHDGASLKRGIYIPADAIPRLGTEPAMKHAEESLVVDEEFLPFLEIRAFPRIRVGQIAIGQILEQFPSEHGNPAFVVYRLLLLRALVRIPPAAACTPDGAPIVPGNVFEKQRITVLDKEKTWRIENAWRPSRPPSTRYSFI